MTPKQFVSKQEYESSTTCDDAIKLGLRAGMTKNDFVFCSLSCSKLILPHVPEVKAKNLCTIALAEVTRYLNSEATEEDCKYCAYSIEHHKNHAIRAIHATALCGAANNDNQIAGNATVAILLTKSVLKSVRGDMMKYEKIVSSCISWPAILLAQILNVNNDKLPKDYNERVKFFNSKSNDELQNLLVYAEIILEFDGLKEEFDYVIGDYINQNFL